MNILKSKIGKKIIILQITFSLFFLSVGSVIYIFVASRHLENEFKTAHEAIFSLAEEGLTQGLWALDQKGIESILNGMLQSQIISEVIIINSENEVVSVGESSGETVKSEFALNYPYRDEIIDLGTLLIFSQKKDLNASLWEHFYTNILIISLFILLFLILLYWNLYFILIRDLNSYTDFLEDLKKDSFFKRFRRKKKIFFNRTDDELDQAFKEFNELMDVHLMDLRALHEKETALTALNNSLEEKVREKTEKLNEKLLELEKANNKAEILLKELEDAAIEEKKANNAKSQFLANMSHEIRTPMGAILGMSDLVLDMTLPAQERSYVQKIHDSALQLLKIINDILDLSRIESGKLSIEKHPFNLTNLIGKLIDVASFKANEKDIEFKTDICMDPSIILLGDSTRLYQILLNLISNAIKFTNQGRVLFETSAQKSGDEILLIQFVISDSGGGIPPDQIEKIFLPYEQASEKIHRLYGGTGLGLTITKSLIELMNGTIALKSELNKGTEFRVELPFKTISADDALLRQTESEDITLEEINSNIQDSSILVVEDNEINREIISNFLKKVEIIPDYALNGAEAIEHLTRKAYDLILMDVHMPVMDGITATEKIRENNEYTGIPIIALTASAMDGEKQICIEAGMNDFITKPFSMDMLLTKINRWLDKRSIPQESDNLTEEYLQAGSIRTYGDFHFGSVLENFGHDNELLKYLMESFIAQFQDTDKIISGLKEDIKMNSVHGAHSLKGVAASLGAESLRSAAEELEKQIRAKTHPDDVHRQIDNVLAELRKALLTFEEYINGTEEIDSG